MVSRCVSNRVREKHFNADGLSKRTEFYESRERSDQKKPAVAVGFGFLEQDIYNSLGTVPWLDKDGRELPEQEEAGCAAREEVRISILRPDEVVKPEVFPVEPREVHETESLVEHREECLNPSECMALALIVKDSAPNIPPVVRDENLVIEPQFQSIKMITPGNLNADEQINEFAKAMRLISAATYSLSDLQRALRTDLITLVLLKLVQSPDSENYRDDLGSPRR